MPKDPAGSNRQQAIGRIDSIRQENEEYYEDERGRGLLRSLELVHDSSSYVAELVQNALDAAPSEDEQTSRIRMFIQSEDEFVFEHSGKPFDYEDVLSISQAGTSTKKLASDIGFMGIGFKSIFKRFQRAEISSGSYRFYFDCPYDGADGSELRSRDHVNMTLPYWSDEIDSPSEGMNCRFALSKTVDSLRTLKDDLAALMGQDKALLVLLARQGVKELNWDGTIWLLESEVLPVNYDGVELRQITAVDSDSCRRWLHLCTEYEPSDEAVRAFAQHRQLDAQSLPDQMRRKVEAFCPLNEEDLPVLPHGGRSFAFLPMEHSLPFRLHLQADWLVGIDRSKPLEENAWHQEIILQVPSLMGGFLKWAAQEQTDSSISYDYLDVLPDFGRKDTEFEHWFADEEFKECLTEELVELPFLPVKKSAEQVKFVSPCEAVFLPQALQQMLDDQWKPWALFSDTVVAANKISENMLSSLKELDLCRKLRLKEMESLWSRNGISEWQGNLSDDDQHKGLLKLLGAICILLLGEYPALKDRGSIEEVKEQIYCIPTEADCFITPQEAECLPPEWPYVVASEPKIEELLKPYAGESSNLLDSDLWQYYQQGRDEIVQDQYVQRFFNLIGDMKLNEVTDRWWDSLPQRPTTEQIDQILMFTWWARKRGGPHFGRTDLINRVLCKDDQGGVLLLSPDDALLGSAYGADYRSSIFPELPEIEGRYVEEDPEHGSIREWYTFLSKLDPAPLGDFSLSPMARNLSRKEVGEQFSDVLGEPPTLRVSYKEKKWSFPGSNMEFEVSSRNYLVVDAHLPEVWPDAAQLDRKTAETMSSWMADNSRSLWRHKALRMVYIPYGQGKPKCKKITSVPAAWVDELTQQKWVPVQGADDVMAPDEVLPERDPARPEAPVADLSAQLIKDLRECGVEFGNKVPDVSILIRLKREGPQIQDGRLLQLLDESLEKAKDDGNIREQLYELISEEPLLPTDSGGRYTHDRFIRSSRGSLMGGWLGTVDGFEDDTPHRTVLEKIHNLFPFPQEPTAQQALAFLQYVWNEEPAADQVRRALPYAYRYVTAKLAEGEEEFTDLWKECVSHARVYTLERQWVSVDDADNVVYFDDIGDEELISYDELSIATSTHLGGSRAERILAAEMLGLPKLSEDFEIKITPKNPSSPPQTWQQAVNALTQVLIEYKIESNQTGPPIELNLRRCDGILVQVFRDGDIWNSADKRAIRDGNSVYVVGDTPAVFGRELSQRLKDLWHLQQQGKLCSDISWLISMMEKPQQFHQHLNEVKKELGLPVSGELGDLVDDDIAAKGDSEEETDGKRTGRQKEQRTEAKEHSEETGKRQERQKDKQYDVTDEVEGEDTDYEQASSDDSGLRGSYTDESVARRIAGKVSELERLLGVGLIPEDESEAVREKEKAEDDEDTKGAVSDEDFRKEAIKYEMEQGRFPEEQASNQPGYDIISYEDESRTQMVRRIEVKGRSHPWTDGQIVVLSSRQFIDALEHDPDKSGWDYWLYVVAPDENDELRVVPIRNPARETRKYRIRADIWQWQAILHDVEDELKAPHE